MASGLSAMYVSHPKNHPKNHPNISSVYGYGGVEVAPCPIRHRCPSVISPPHTHTLLLPARAARAQSSYRHLASIVGLRLSDTWELEALALWIRLGKSGRGTADPEWQRGRGSVRYTTLLTRPRLSPYLTEVKSILNRGFQFRDISFRGIGSSVYRCLAAGIRPWTTACERCSEAAYPT